MESYDGRCQSRCQVINNETCEPPRHVHSMITKKTDQKKSKTNHESLFR